MVESSTEFINRIEEEFQDNNDIIAQFCGGKLETIPYLGTIYRFDDKDTFEPLMKFPPFGFILRSGEDGIRCMEYHYKYDWLMYPIRCCWQKANTSELKESYDKIKESLTEFLSIEIPYTNGTKKMELIWTYYKVLDFIKLYKELK